MEIQASTQTDKLALSLGKVVIKHPWKVILVSILVMLTAASGTRLLNFSNNYRTFFSPDNPELVTFEDFQNTYTKSDNFLFVLKPSSGQVFSPQATDAIESLTQKAWDIPFAIRVDSVSNFQHSWADGDDLTVDDLIRDGKNLSTETLASKQQIALNEPLLKHQLISENAGATGINVTLQYPEQSLTEVPQAVNFARSLVADIEANYPDIKVALTGVSMLNNAFAESGQSDAMSLIPIMYLILLVTMVVTLRSFWATFGTTLVIILSTATAMGVAGYLGYTLDPISLTAPTIILTLAIADSIHLLVSMLTFMREGLSKKDSLLESLRVNFLAISITSLTTIVGFSTLNFSDAPPFWYLGNITAIGIAAAWYFSLFFLPAFLTVVPLKVKQIDSEQSGKTGSMVNFASFVTRHHRKILYSSGIVAAVCIAFIPRVDLNDEWVKYFDESLEFRQDADFAMENLTGLYLLEYSIPAENSGAVSEPEYLANLEKMTNWLRAQPEVIHVYSYSDIIKRLNKNMHGDDQEWYQIPEDRNLAAQYLLLYELSLPYGLDLNDRINIDKSATRVSATLDELSTVEVREFITRSENWLQENVPDYMQASPTGPTVMFSYISERNINSMLRGNVVAVVLIAVIMILSLRSLGLGTMSLLPNTIPILMAFGLWGLLVGKVGMAAATVSATSLGIIVDNTVHFLTKYLRGLREHGYERPAAIEYAFKMVGKAVLLNAVILTAGFLVLTSSSFKVNVEMGSLTAMTVVIALLVDFLLLPALLMIGYRKKEGVKDENISPVYAD